MAVNVSKARRAGRPVGPRRHANLANWRVMQWFDQRREADGLTMVELARRLGYKSASRVGQYFRQQIVAGPDMVRQMALALGISPVEALWRAEHYGAVFAYLNQLYTLGWSWMREDCVGFSDHFGCDFVVHYIRATGGIPEGVELDEVPLGLANRYHSTNIYNDAGIFVKLSMSKPIACAILLAVAMFPRRGEKLRPNARAFLEQLATVVGKLAPRAARASRAQGIPSELLKTLSRPLSAAEDILPWRFYGHMRLAIVAEYVHAWCDIASAAYAEYARLALYEHGAFINPEFEDDIWKWKRAQLPSVGDLEPN